MLNRGGGGSLKPLLGIYPVALNSNEAASRVRCSDADRKIVTTAAAFPVEFYLQFGVPFHRVFLSVSDNRKLNFAKAAVLVVPQLEYVIARFSDSQQVTRAVRGDGNGLRFR